MTMLQLFKTIDSELDRITMYRVVLYYAALLIVVAFALSFFGLLAFSPLQLLFSTALILAVSALANWVFAWGFDAPANVESPYITALVIVLIMNPVSWTDAAGVAGLVFASVWAMASKFIFAYRRKHIFNPAAFGVAISSFMIGQSATWWIGGSLWLLPFVTVGGLLVVRKIRRFDLMFGFFGALFAAIALTSSDAVTTSVQALLYTPVLFFAFAMLSEPLTTPPTALRRVLYGGFVGVLLAPAVNIFGFFFTPELALLAGNIFSFLMSPKERFMLTLVERNKLGNGVYEFVFSSDRREAFAFTPGQYIEWTLGHSRPDSRGNRRYFTIASSPEDEYIRIGVKVYDAPSSFKKAIFKLPIGGVISASHLSGDFVMPRDPKRKLAFIAGGIGVTPFASMTRHMIDSGESRDVVMLYSNKKADEIAYRDVFDRAAELFGMKTTYVLSGEVASLSTPGDTYMGTIDRNFIEKRIPDHAQRTFYLSGPHGMVSAMDATLRSMGVPRRRIKKDFFPGLA